ncbi:MAG TPA: alpha/beta fold hydrolase [Solirubrobacteraceae bacterium]|nr:alpha/beta fold hydrolase [Solirubrobacteraceae bacterium]
MRTRTGDIETAWHDVGIGPPVVLVHGLADDHRAWRRVAGRLMLDHRVILYDLRGHGQSTLGEPEGTLTQLGGDLLALCDALSLERCTLAGFSLGGTIAMRAAIDAPERVAALALIATSSRVNSAAQNWYLERAALVEAHDERLRDTLDRDTADVYRARPEETAAGLHIRRASTHDPRGYANACRAMAGLRERPLDGELHRIAAPTTIVAGEVDQHCPPRAAEIIAERIGGSGIEVLPGAGHPLPVERPDETAEAIRRITEAAGA